jgi:hypothetical protein
LPETYKLIAGTEVDDIHAYYELIKVNSVGTAHGNKLILEVPLKTDSQRFSLFKILALPVRVFNNNFALYQIKYDYFGLSYSQRDFLLLTTADVQKCHMGSITFCPANRALYDVRSITCESKLFFQNTNKDGHCKRSLMLRYEKLALLWHGQTWIYHFPNQHQVIIRCPRDNI